MIEAPREADTLPVEQTIERMRDTLQHAVDEDFANPNVLRGFLLLHKDLEDVSSPLELQERYAGLDLPESGIMFGSTSYNFIAEEYELLTGHEEIKSPTVAKLANFAAAVAIGYEVRDRIEDIEEIVGGFENPFSQPQWAAISAGNGERFAITYRDEVGLPIPRQHLSWHSERGRTLSGIAGDVDDIFLAETLYLNRETGRTFGLSPYVHHRPDERDPRTCIEITETAEVAVRNFGPLES